MNHQKIHFIHLETVDSTNTWVKTHASTLPSQGVTCVTAEQQTAGRGRWNRPWISFKNQNITATLYFCIPKESPYLENIPQILALSCTKALSSFGFEAKIKWPNDIVVFKQKIAGILCEVVELPHGLGRALGIVLGLGLNVNMNEEQLNSLNCPATSLLKLSGNTWNKEVVLDALLTQFLEDLPALKKWGFAPFHPAFFESLAYKGEEISFHSGSERITGICHGLTAQGRLQLLTSTKKIHEFSAGEIQFS